MHYQCTLYFFKLLVWIYIDFVHFRSMDDSFEPVSDKVFPRCSAAPEHLDVSENVSDEDFPQCSDAPENSDVSFGVQVPSL